MLKTLVKFISILSIFPSVASAQWTGSVPGPIYYNSGNVGIGTANPASALEVQGVTNGWLMDLRTNAINPGEINGLKFYSGYLNDTNKWAGISSVAESLHSNSTGLALYSNAAELMRLAANGNVGIGTTIPSQKLTVSTFGDGSSVAPLLRLEQYNAGSPANGTGVSIDMAIGDNYNLPALAGQIRLTRSDYTNTSMHFSTALANTVTERMVIDPNGNIGIGTNDPQGHKLAVNGDVIATSVVVKLHADWPDYVFKNTYKLPSLSGVKAYIDQNQHLPEIPSAQEVLKQGIDLGEMNKLLVKKVEELTLYLITQNEQLQEQKKASQSQNKVNQSQQVQIDQLKKQLNLLIRKQ